MEGFCRTNVNLLLTRLNFLVFHEHRQKTIEPQIFKNDLVKNCAQYTRLNFPVFHEHGQKTIQDHENSRTNSSKNCAQYTQTHTVGLTVSECCLIKLLPYILFEIYINIFKLEMASPGNRHCANCIGALSFHIQVSAVDNWPARLNRAVV